MNKLFLLFVSLFIIGNANAKEPRVLTRKYLTRITTFNGIGTLHYIALSNGDSCYIYASSAGQMSCNFAKKGW